MMPTKTYINNLGQLCFELQSFDHSKQEYVTYKLVEKKNIFLVYKYIVKKSWENNEKKPIPLLTETTQLDKTFVRAIVYSGSLHMFCSTMTNSYLEKKYREHIKNTIDSPECIS